MENIGARLLLVLAVFLLGWGVKHGLKNKKIAVGYAGLNSIIFYKNKSPIAYWTTIVTWVLLLIFFIGLLIIL